MTTTISIDAYFDNFLFHNFGSFLFRRPYFDNSSFRSKNFNLPFLGFLLLKTFDWWTKSAFLCFIIYLNTIYDFHYYLIFYDSFTNFKQSIEFPCQTIDTISLDDCDSLYFGSQNSESRRKKKAGWGENATENGKKERADVKSIVICAVVT